jgi:hypothetical protein
VVDDERIIELETTARRALNDQLEDDEDSFMGEFQEDEEAAYLAEFPDGAGEGAGAGESQAENDDDIDPDLALPPPSAQAVVFSPVPIRRKRKPSKDISKERRQKKGLFGGLDPAAAARSVVGMVGEIDEDIYKTSSLAPTPNN